MKKDYFIRKHNFVSVSTTTCSWQKKLVQLNKSFKDKFVKFIIMMMTFILKCIRVRFKYSFFYSRFTVIVCYIESRGNIDI